MEISKNFIRFHLLNEASKNAVQLDDFKNFLTTKISQMLPIAK